MNIFSYACYNVFVLGSSSQLLFTPENTTIYGQAEIFQLVHKLFPKNIFLEPRK